MTVPSAVVAVVGGYAFGACLQPDFSRMGKSLKAISGADLLIVAGTSLTVYPAAGLINYYRGNKLVLVNLSETPYDSYADLVIHEKIGEVFAQI